MTDTRISAGPQMVLENKAGNTVRVDLATRVEDGSAYLRLWTPTKIKGGRIVTDFHEAKMTAEQLAQMRDACANALEILEVGS